MAKKPTTALILAALLCFSVVGTTDAMLLASDWAGNLYDVNTSTAALSFIGSTGIDRLSALEFAPDGTLYGFSAGPAANFYTINPTTGSASMVGPLGLSFAFEGGLAFGNGVAYGVNGGDCWEAQLFQVDLATGATTVIGTMNPSGREIDINGLSWRNDGVLVGIDNYSGNFVTIDPVTGTIFGPEVNAGFTLGGIGGLAIDDPFHATGYMATGIIDNGTNSLYSFDQYAGTPGFIGSFGADVRADYGISGLAASPVPEPGTLGLFGLGLAGVVAGIRRKKRAVKA